MNNVFAVTWFPRSVLLLGLGAASACGSDDPTVESVGATLADGCSINSDCNDPLVCAFRKCHNACTATRDCPAGARCVASERPYRVCQLPTEVTCAYNSECPTSQVCGIDKKCRDQCTSDRDCVPEQVCSVGACADVVELTVDGGLPPAVGVNTSGVRCVYNSDCAEPPSAKRDNAAPSAT